MDKGTKVARLHGALQELKESKVQDRVTGFEGFVLGIAVYIDGTEIWQVQPQVKEDGSWMESKWIDAHRLKIIQRKSRQNFG